MTKYINSFWSGKPEVIYAYSVNSTLVRNLYIAIFSLRQNIASFFHSLLVFIILFLAQIHYIIEDDFYYESTPSLTTFELADLCLFPTKSRSLLDRFSIDYPELYCLETLCSNLNCLVVVRSKTDSWLAFDSFRRKKSNPNSHPQSFTQPT